MKKILMALLVLIAAEGKSQSLIGGKNIIKTNLSSDILNNYNLTYERSLNHFMSVSLSYRTMPKSTLPFKSTIKSYLDKYTNSTDINLDDFQIGNTAITLEGRFYLGLQKMSGFYIAPYIRNSNFDLSVPIKYKVDPAKGNTESVGNFNGNISANALGAYFGVQYQILTKVVLDFWIAGGSYGTSSGVLKFTSTIPLPAEAQASLKDALDQIKADPFKLKSTVNASGGSADMSGPWAGFRGLGLTVGIRF